ncbi:hypothetical protein H7I75_01510 [Mycobacterium stomatepiae]|nr:hypothetical protein [Mycobacterium stomatepiae]MCV7163095.1 hypothetical protein [Mycobacterium stomatepiae]
MMRPGDEVVVLPVGKISRITAIEGPNGPVEEAFPPMARVRRCSRTSKRSR